MNKLHLIGGVVAAVVTAQAAGAAVTNLDFDSLRNASSTSVTYVQGPYHEDGYTLTAAACQTSLGVPNAGCFIGVAPYKSSDKVGTSLATQYVSTKVTVARDDGEAFLLQSIDFSEYFDNGEYGPFTTNVNFTFNFADGTTGTATRVIDNAGKYLNTHFTFDVAALTSFSWTPITGSGVQFDNIMLADVPVAAAVPEPASWALMIAGFGLTGAALRRRRMGRAFA